MSSPMKLWGSRRDNGAGSLNIVILDIPNGRTFTSKEIEAEVFRRGLTGRGAVREHLDSLAEKGHVVKVPGGWQRISDAGV